LKNYITDEEKEFIKNNTDKTAKEIGDFLGRSSSSIHHFCNRNGISLRLSNTPLSEMEKKFILSSKDNLTIDVISNVLNRTDVKIKQFLSELDS
jgi:hypothetical protein